MIRAKFQAVFLLATLAVTSPALAENLCKPQALPGSSRTVTVQVKKDRFITIVGHHHGDRQLPFELQRLSQTSLADLSNEKWTEDLNRLSATSKLAIQHTTEDAAYLEGLLKDTNAIQFVGFESTAATAQNNLNGYTSLMAAFDKRSRDRRLNSSKRFAPLMTAAVGPVFYLKITQPELFVGQTIKGFESPEANKAYAEAAAQALQANALLRAAAKGEAKFLGDISSTDFQLWNLYGKFNPEVDVQRLYEMMEKAPVPAAYRDLTLSWVQARLHEMVTLKAREQAVIDGLIASEESGILFMGQKHLDSTIGLLVKKCKTINEL